MTMPQIAASLAEFIDARVKYLRASEKSNPALAMKPAQHVEVARLLMTADRYARMFDTVAPETGETADLVGALDAFYTGLAHLAMAYPIQWGIPETPDAP